MSWHVPPAALTKLVANIFRALGLEASAARIVAKSLVTADLEGIPSHGVMLVPMYAERIRAGSVSVQTTARIVSDRETAIVLDAENMLGQLSSHQAVALLDERAHRYGMAMVVVRNGFHFGTAGQWAQTLAERGCIGIAMSNTRPLMPAPGGAEKVVGNNPLAIALPTASGAPIVLDMAMSATAMGKIRMADAAGQPIPEGWATDASGAPTTDPAAAIKGMLLPAAGPKGFGLAFVIDLLCGGLASGAIGETVRPLYGDATQPYACAHGFIAIEVARFRDLVDFESVVARFAERVRLSKRAPGVEALFTPGEPAWRTRQANADACALAAETRQALVRLASSLGIAADMLH